MCPIILFASPKQGGILQSSGFLDLKSLMALSRTAKAHALDEQSLTLLIENEVTRDHKCQSMKEAITLLKEVYGCCYELSFLLKQQKPNRVLKRWLERDGTSTMPITSDMLSEAACYDVMLARMLRTITSNYTRLHLARAQDRDGRSLLHHTARSGNVESIKIAIALYPESERPHAVVNVQSQTGWTVLHYAVASGHIDSIRLVLALIPESQHAQVACVQYQKGRTLLHCAVFSRNIESLKTIIALYPDSQHLQMLSMQDEDGRTVLHHAVGSLNTESINILLGSLPEAQRLQIVSIQAQCGDTILHMAVQYRNHDALDTILALLPDGQRLSAVSLQCRFREPVLHCAANSNDLRSVHAILTSLPESKRVQAVCQKAAHTGWSVLHCAARSRSPETIEYLLTTLFSGARAPIAFYLTDSRNMTFWMETSHETRSTVMEWKQTVKNSSLDNKWNC